METDRDLLIASVSALIITEIWKAYENNAPSIADVRAADPDDLAMKQRLIDADFTIGSIGLAIGVIFAVKANDHTLIVIIAALLAALSWWRYEILEGEARSWSKN